MRSGLGPNSLDERTVVGKRITFHVDLPQVGRVTLRAEIRDIRPDYGYAVEFVDLSDDTRAMLDEVIERMLTRSPGDDVY